MDLVLDTDAPANPDYTAHVADAFAESVRVLNHHTAKRGALKYPADTYDVIGRLNTGAVGLRQLFTQLADWLNEEQLAGRVRADVGDTEEQVRTAARALAEAADTADALNETLRAALRATSRLAANRSA